MTAQGNGMQTAQSTLDNDIDLKAVLAILYRQRRLMAATLALVSSLALAYLLVATPIHTATVLIQVDGRSSNLLDPSGAAQEQSAILNSRVDSEVEILRSEATALAVVQATGLMTDDEFGPRIGGLERLGLALGIDLDRLRRGVGLAPRSPVAQEALVKATLQRLQDAVDVRRRGLTYLIAISVSSATPQRAAELANAYARVYIERQVATKTESTITARDVLRRQIDTAQQELATSEAAVNGFIEDNLARLQDETGDPAVAALRARLDAAKAARSQTRARIASAETALAAGDWNALAFSLGDQAVAELARQRADLAARLDRAGGDDAAAPDLAAELAAVDADLAARSEDTLRLLDDSLSTLDSRESQARDRLRDLLLESDLSAALLADLFNLQQRATAARDQYQTLIAREQDLGTMANLQVADARIVSEALPPNAPSFPDRRLILSLALIGGLGLGAGLAFLKEFYIGGIISASQLANVLQAPVPVTFGLLDQVRAGEDPADVVALTPMSVYAETFRKLRAAVDVGLAAPPPPGPGHIDEPAPRGRVLLVCSALQAEGKSTTAIALARTYAMAGVRTLLIDADMRRPSIGPRLNLEGNPGLIHYIAPPQDRPDRMIDAARDSLSDLVVIPAGPRSATPTDQLLNGAAFRNLIGLAVRDFDIVILDSPPLLPVVDTRYLARHADAILHVVRYATTTQGEVREACAQLTEHLARGVHYIGVLNLEERATVRYGGYGRYGYYGQEPA